MIRQNIKVVQLKEVVDAEEVLDHAVRYRLLKDRSRVRIDDGTRPRACWNW